MKLSRHAFVSFWDLHAWTGVVAGLLLHAMFFLGAIALFREPLGIWQEPRLHVPAGAAASDLDAVVTRAVARGELPRDGFYLYPPHDAHPAAFGFSGEGGVWQSRFVDPASGALVKPQSDMADFLYGLHFFWIGQPGWEWLYWSAGFLGVALALAIVTGVLIHLKDLVRQFHQFRPEKRLRTVWSDLHKVLGVIGLPFQLLFAFSGAVLCLYGFMAPAYVAHVFDGDEARLGAIVYGASATPPPAAIGTAAAPLPIDTLLARARAAWPGLRPEYAQYLHHGDAGASLAVSGPVAGGAFASGEVLVRATDGAILRTGAADAGAFVATTRVLYGLHFADYGGLAIRVLYAWLAIAGCLTMLTGNWVWLSRREKTRAHPGNRILRRLTVGFGAGLCVATAALFVANRALPWDLGDRAFVEKLVFAGTFVAALAWSVVAREAGLWARQLALAGSLCVAVPVVGAIATRAAAWRGRSPATATVLAVDLTVLAVGVGLCALAAFLWRRTWRR